MEARGARPARCGAPAWLLGLVPLLLVAARGIAAARGARRARAWASARGPPVEELAVERTVLRPGVIELHGPQRRPRPGPSPRSSVNDAYVAVHRRRAARSAGWSQANRARPVRRGSRARPTRSRCSPRPAARSCHVIQAAAETPDADIGFFGLMALLGLYVGVIPVALGMLWLPFVRRCPRGWLRVLLALTVGLLGFLAIDATLEGIEIAGDGLAGVRRRGAGPRSAALVAYLALRGVDGVADGRARRAARPRRHAGAARRDRHRPAQPRRGPRHRWRVRGRRAGAGRVPRRRLRAAQHHRGPRHRRPARTRSRDRSAGSRCSA